jgi:hypothetical protein
LAEQFKNCEIVVRNSKLTLHGSKQEVVNAKLKAVSMLNDILEGQKSELQFQIRITRDVQWQYEANKDEWKSFSFYINSLIESRYSRKESHVK